MADIFREVDEEVRRDRALEFWKKYQTLLIVVAVLIVAGAGAWRLYQEHQRQLEEAAGARYEAALQLARDSKAVEADSAFQNIIHDGPAGYALLARFRAAADVADGDRAKGISIYDAIIADQKIPAPMRDVARLRAGLLRLDEADDKELNDRLGPLTVPGSPFRNTAREMLAVAALKHEDFTAAGRWLDAIVVDAQAPQGARQRAEAFLGIVAGGKPRTAAEPRQTTNPGSTSSSAPVTEPVFVAPGTGPSLAPAPVTPEAPVSVPEPAAAAPEPAVSVPTDVK